MNENILKHVVKSFVIIAIVSLWNCKQPNNNTALDSFDSISTPLPSIDSLVDIIYSMPDPDEILNEIFIENIELKSGIIYSTEKTNQLFEYNSMALHLGVLMADMTYLLLQENNNEAVEYFRAIVQLSDRLDLRVYKNKDLLNKIQNNIDNKNALLVIFKESISDIKYELDYSKRNKDLALIYTGSIIETFYLAINNIDNNNSQVFSEHILKQYSILISLEAFLSYYRASSDIQQLIEQLDSINYYMDKCIVHDTISTTKEYKDKQLYINRGNSVVFKMESFDSVRKKITELRNTIIEN